MIKILKFIQNSKVAKDGRKLNLMLLIRMAGFAKDSSKDCTSHLTFFWRITLSNVFVCEATKVIRAFTRASRAAQHHATLH